MLPQTSTRCSDARACAVPRARPVRFPRPAAADFTRDGASLAVLRDRPWLQRTTVTPLGAIGEHHATGMAEQPSPALVRRRVSEVPGRSSWP